jgi:hypothetical protein
MNQVEIWFGILTHQRIRRDSFTSVRQLRSAINDFTTAWNARAQPFVWTKTSDHILLKARRRIV